MVSINVTCCSARPNPRRAKGFPIFFGEKLYAAKWRNFKLHFVWQMNATDPVLQMGIPAVFNLLTNPRENPDENLAATHVWVITAASRMIAEFQVSLNEYPPIVAGTPDPYVPPEPVAAKI